MNDFLKEIIMRKKQEIASLSKRRSFKEALRGPHLKVIAEIKRKSPSKGDFAKINDPCFLAEKYMEGGASALSILTDAKGFGGSLDDLYAVEQECEKIPLLRKDFIIDPVQIKESIAYGASAILLIVAILGNRTKDMLEKTRAAGLEALVEVHSEEELEIALEAGAEIIGINNRNLSTFEVDLSISENLIEQIPASIVRVSESGIHSIEDAIRMRRAGFDAILVGEALVKAENPAEKIKEFSLL